MQTPSLGLVFCDSRSCRLEGANARAFVGPAPAELEGCKSLALMAVARVNTHAAGCPCSDPVRVVSRVICCAHRGFKLQNVNDARVAHLFAVCDGQCRIVLCESIAQPVVMAAIDSSTRSAMRSGFIAIV